MTAVRVSEICSALVCCVSIVLYSQRTRPATCAKRDETSRACRRKSFTSSPLLFVSLIFYVCCCCLCCWCWCLPGCLPVSLPPVPVPVVAAGLNVFHYISNCTVHKCCYGIGIGFVRLDSYGMEWYGMVWVRV